MNNKIKTLLAALLLTTCAAEPAWADPVGGPRVGSGVAARGETDAYSVRLFANETTIFRMSGDGDGDLDCRAIDDNGNTVAEDYSSADGCFLSVSPRWPAYFRFEFTNNGSGATAYLARIY